VEARVLIVDDDSDLRDTLVRLLGRLGYKCRAASSGADAILALEAAGPDLVVTSLLIPETDGWAVVRHARKHCPPIPVIVLTAYPRTIREMEGTTYVTKPFTSADLEKAVQRAVGHPPTPCASPPRV
jgi:two-component system OmpR family response regulator